MDHHVKVAFSPFKTRAQIANELEISVYLLKQKLIENNISIPNRNLIPIDSQVQIYSCIMGESFLINTDYEEYL